MIKPLGNAGADDGFTLLELLVTLAVLSFISTIMFGAVFSVQRVAHQLVADESAQSEVAAAQALLRSQVEGLRAVQRSDRATPVVDVQGDDQRLSFYAPPIDRDAPSSLQAVRLLRMSTGDLVLFSAPSLTEDLDLRSPNIEGWKATRLLQGVDQLSISYFGPGPGTSGPRWQRFWSDRAQPPMLVRIGIRFGEDDRRIWPELVIRPGVTVNTACRFDVVTSRCSELAGS